MFVFYDLQSDLFLISDEPDMSHMAAEQDILVASGFRQNFVIPGATKLSHLGCSYSWQVPVGEREETGADRDASALPALPVSGDEWLIFLPLPWKQENVLML